MAKAQLTLPGGVVVNMEGSPEEIHSLLEKLGGASTKSHGTPKPEARKKRTVAKAPKSKSSRVELTDLIINLIDGGFFKKPKDLAAIKGALEELGHRYPVTSLSPTMLRQVRKRNLRRIKQDQRWMYTG